MKSGQPICTKPPNRGEHTDAKNAASQVSGLDETCHSCACSRDVSSSEEQRRDRVQHRVLRRIRGSLQRMKINTQETTHVEYDALLNMSSIRLVMTNPPETFTNASSTESAPSACGSVPGKYPPPMMNRPPTPTIPNELPILVLWAHFWHCLTLT